MSPLFQYSIFALTTFSCGFALTDDVEFQIGSIHVEVELSPVKCTDPIMLVDHSTPPDAIIDALKSAVQDMMAMIDKMSNHVCQWCIPETSFLSLNVTEPPF